MLRRAFVLMALGLTLWPQATLAQSPARDPAKVPAGAYVLDTRQSSLAIRIPLMGGLSRYTMRFNKLSGSFDYDPASWQSTQVEITVDPRAVEAQNTMFNRAIVGYFEPAICTVIDKGTETRCEVSNAGDDLLRFGHRPDLARRILKVVGNLTLLYLAHR